MTRCEPKIIGEKEKESEFVLSFLPDVGSTQIVAQPGKCSHLR